MNMRWLHPTLINTRYIHNFLAHILAFSIIYYVVTQYIRWNLVHSDLDSDNPHFFWVRRKIVPGKKVLERFPEKWSAAAVKKSPKKRSLLRMLYVYTPSQKFNTIIRISVLPDVIKIWKKLVELKKSKMYILHNNNNNAKMLLRNFPNKIFPQIIRWPVLFSFQMNLLIF